MFVNKSYIIAPNSSRILSLADTFNDRRLEGKYYVRGDCVNERRLVLWLRMTRCGNLFPRLDSNLWDTLRLRGERPFDGSIFHLIVENAPQIVHAYQRLVKSSAALQRLPVLKGHVHWASKCADEIPSKRRFVSAITWEDDFHHVCHHTEQSQ